jgi:hypothetical protein
MMDMEKLCQRLLVKMEADRKTDKEEMLAKMDANMKVYQEKMEANRKKGKDDFLAKLNVNQDKLLATMEADQEERRVGQEKLREKIETEKEEMKAAMRSMRSDLGETIQHRIENIFQIFEHDKRVLQSELEGSLCTRTTKLQEDLTKNYNERCAAIDEAKREFRARSEVV